MKNRNLQSKKRNFQIALNLDRPVAPVLDVRSEQYQQFSVNVYVLQSRVLSELSSPMCLQ